MKTNNRIPVRIERTSPVTGKKNVRTIEVTNSDLIRYSKGEAIQNCFPYLSASDREFLISGCTEEDWKELFGEEE
jgi:hypothetical protein